MNDSNHIETLTPQDDELRVIEYHAGVPILGEGMLVRAGGSGANLEVSFGEPFALVTEATVRIKFTKLLWSAGQEWYISPFGGQINKGPGDREDAVLRVISCPGLMRFAGGKYKFNFRINQGEVIISQLAFTVSGTR